MSSNDTLLFARVGRWLGHLIFYSDELGADDKIVLRPDWLSKAISFVLEDAMTFACHGFVPHARLREIWDNPERPADERYAPDVRRLLLRLMTDFDICYQIEDRASLVAQLVQGERPSFEWTDSPAPGEQQLVQICEIVDRERGNPVEADGLFYRIIVRLHRYSLGRHDVSRSRHWQKGVVLDYDYNGRALIEYIGHDIRVTVRAAFPKTFLDIIVHTIRDTVEYFWSGVRCRIVVPCLAPCGLDRPGHGRFEVEKLLKSLGSGKPDYPCKVPDCDVWQSIPALLHNAPSAPTQSDLLLEIQRLEAAVSDIPHQILSRIDGQFESLREFLDDEARLGPRLFSLTVVEPSFLDKPDWAVTKVRVTLWCEHSRCPVALLDGREWRTGAPGVYEFDAPREWLSKAAPIARQVGSTLSLVLRVMTAGFISADAIKEASKQLEFGQQSLESLAQTFDRTAGWVDGARTGVGSFEQGRLREASGAVLRLLHDFLIKRDPTFGGLEKVPGPQRNRHIWVHSKFKDEYVSPLRSLQPNSEAP